MQDTIALYPVAVVSHLNPMLALGELFLRRGLAVTVVLIEPLFHKAQFFAAVEKAAARNPSMSFHVLPLPDAGAAAAAAIDSSGYPLVQMDNFQLAHAPSLLSFLRSTPTVVAVVLDLYCSHSIDATSQAGIPTYLFCPIAAASLAAHLHWAQFGPDGIKLKELGDAPLNWPGVPTFPASHFLPDVAQKEDEVTKLIRNVFQRAPDADGILVNTFKSLEAQTVAALRADPAVAGRHLPPVYCVGPVAGKGDNERPDGGKQRHECLAWLDAQPDRSVVFLCFGSMRPISAELANEVAKGLELAGHRFLWVVRAPTSATDGEPDLDAVLPEGFLERTKERGLVVKNWAPQVEVLNHLATGAFVTHCGWNSTLEAITAGVPMLCFPLYAEQQLNKVFIVESMRVGVGLRGYDKGMVRAEELEEKIKFVMESEGGKELTEQAAALARASAAATVNEGGSSSLAAEQFLNDMRSWKRSAGETVPASVKP